MILSKPDKWDTYFFSKAITASRMSKDPSTKVGAVIENHGKEISSGFNGFPRGVPDLASFLDDRETKIKLVEHAERNALSQALFNSGAIQGGTMFITHCPCRDCAKGIIQAGIRRIKFPYYPDFEKRWDFEFTSTMLDWGGVEYSRYSVEEIKNSIEEHLGIVMPFLPGVSKFACQEI